MAFNDPVRPEPNAQISPSSLQVADDVYPITPDDDTDLPVPIRAIRADGGGEITAVTGAGNERTFKIADGETRYIHIVRVLDTGTTATDIEGMT